jgi:hypothetical protein
VKTPPYVPRQKFSFSRAFCRNIFTIGKTCFPNGTYCIHSQNWINLNVYYSGLCTVSKHNIGSYFCGPEQKQKVSLNLDSSLLKIIPIKNLHFSM